MKKISVIFDSDITNNVEDRFALVYALSNSDKLNIKAITIEPYKFKEKDISIDEMQLDSKFEARRILSLMNLSSEGLIFEGSESYFKLDGNNISPAVKKMADEAKKTSCLTIITTGTLTNVAVLISAFPEVKQKIKVVWLGTGNLLLDKFDDSNYKNDKLAFEVVAKSGVDFTIIPNYVARGLVSSLYEMEYNISESVVGKYLIKCVKELSDINETLGIRTIYDIVPVGYVLHPEFFNQKDISVNELFKEQKHLKTPHGVHYVFEMLPNALIWKDFVFSINKNNSSPFKENVYFISDTHFTQQRKVNLKQVPWGTVEESDREIVRRWNQKVSKDDTVYHLGDFGNYEKVKELNGKIILICGNYEEADYGNDFESFRKKLLNLGFSEVYQKGIYLDESVLGEKIYLTHKPTTHAIDCISMFGHVHTLAPIKRFGFNVCLAYHNYAPVSTKEAKRYINFIKYFADEDVFS